MKALLFHAKEYGVQFNSLATRPMNVEPEVVSEHQQSCIDCVAVFITVEKGDDAAKVSLELSKEVAKMCRDVARENIVLVPFAHLSNSLASSQISKDVITRVEQHLKKDFVVTRTHFGSHKSLLLDVYGHPGNVRFREF
jgi:threonyl-tRNA synthetase